MTIVPPVARTHRAAVVWIDGWHAFVARMDHGLPRITEVDRDLSSMPDFHHRVAGEARDCDRLMILGAGGAVSAFEHEYEHLYPRSRFIEAECAAAATPAELTDRLRLLESDEGHV